MSAWPATLHCRPAAREVCTETPTLTPHMVTGLFFYFTTSYLPVINYDKGADDWMQQTQDRHQGACVLLHTCSTYMYYHGVALEQIPTTA